MNTQPAPQDNDDFANENMQKRLKNMFSDQEPPTFASIREVQAMEERIHELEAQLAQKQASERPSSSSKTTMTSPSLTQPLVEKELPVDKRQQVTGYLFRAALFLLGAAVFSLPLYVYLAARMHLWQLNALIGVSLVFAATSALGAWLVRRGRVALSGSLLLGGLSLIVLTVPMLIAGLGLIMGLAFPLVILIAVSPALSSRAAIRATIASALVGVITIVLSSIWQSYQITIPELQVAIPVIAVTNAVLTGFMVIRQFPSYPLRIKLVVMLVSVALVSIGAVAFALNSIMSGLIQQDVGDDLSVLAQNKAMEIGTTVTHEKNTLETLTLNQFLKWEADVINGSHTAKELDRLDKQWREAADDDPLIAQVLNNAMTEELHHFQARFPQFVEIFLTDSYGANIAATNRTSDYYQADEEWWQSAWNDGKGDTYISQATFDESAGIYAIDIALPFYNDRSRLIGILRATVDVTPFKDALRAGEFAQTGKIELVFPDRQALNGDVDSPLFQLDSESAASLDSLQASFDQLNYEGSPSLISKQLVFTSEGKDKQTMEQLGWYVVVHQDESEALLPVTISTRTTLIISLLMLLITSALAIYVGRLLTTPLTQLTSVVAQVSQGNLTAQANIHSRDEIGTLASTFNSMTTQLHSLITSMEQRVEERTHDLALAAEVGRAVSEKVGNLNVMLTEAAETIRSNFDLYYTQVYLVDLAGRSLVLRAGTGKVGTQLLHRGHRLAVASTSLNGRAALERRPIYIGDTQSSPSFLPNPLLPLTRSELAVPLIVNDRVVGVLDMQSQRPETFSEASLPAFQVLAGQLAIAIQNSILFNQTEEARLQVEDQARLLSSSRWDEFLNAIDIHENIGYVFSQDEVLPLVETQAPVFENTLVAPIEITGTNIGNLQLADEASRKWTSAETEIVEATTLRVAQHIENLRLFAQSERYRAQAEQVSRRLTREGWSSYLSTRRQLENGYVYDQNMVQTLPAQTNGNQAPLIVQPVMVRDEMIGELTVDQVNATDEAATQIFSAVAQKLSEHIENLRLVEAAQERTLELEETQSFLDSVVENLPTMLFVKDAEELRFVRWNKAEEELIGLERESVIGKNDYDLFPKEQADVFTYNDRQVLVSGQMLDVPEEPLQTTQLGLRYLHTRKVPILGADGKPKYLLGISEDITERKQAEESLRLSEARLSEALKIAKLAHWEYDVERDIFTFNDHFYSIFHTTADKVGGYELSSAQYVEFFVLPEDAAIVGNEIAKVLASTDRHFTAKLEHRINFADGGTGHISVEVHVERDENGKITRWYGANQDITERKKAEEIIRLAHQRAQIILESVTIPMVITRLADNHLTFVNPPALEVTQFQYEEVINQPAPDFYYNLDDRKRFIAELRAKGQVADMVVQLRRGNGEVFWALMSARIFEYQSEASILTTFMDITEQILAREGMAKRAKELQTVAEVSTTSATTLEPDRLLQAVVDLTKERFGLYHAHIYLADESRNALLLVAGAGEIGRKLVVEEHAIPLDLEQSLVARSARERRAVIVNDVSNEPGFLPNPFLPETCAEMAVPMIVGDRVLGVFDVQSNNPIGFSEEDASIYVTLAAQVGVALQNARLFDQTQEALSWQQAINRTSVMIGEAKTIEDIVRSAAELLPLLGMLSCSVNLIKEIDSGGKPLLSDIHIVRFVENEFIPMPPVLGQPTIGWLPDDPKYYQENRLTVFPNLEDLTTIVPSTAYKAEGAVAYMRKVGMQSAIALSLGVHNRAIGYLTFTSQTPLAHVPERYIAWLAGIVDLISAAIDNQLLLAETELGRQSLGRRATELETVATVSTTASTVLDPDELLQSVVDLTKERFGLYHAHIYLADESWNILLLAAGAGDVGRKMVADGWNIPIDHEQSIVASAARNRKSVIANDVVRDQSSSFLSNQLLPDTRSEMAVPMIVGQRLLGVFDVQADTTEYFTEEDANIYTTLAAQVAVALQNARLYVEQSATVSQLRELDRLKSSFLANMSHELRTPLNSILGFTDVMLEGLDGLLTDYMDNDLRLIQKNGQHLLHLINDVLDMAKIESGRMNLNPETFKIHSVLEEVTSITSTLASEKNLSLFIDESSDQEIEVYADNTRLRQVMINLVNNAIKFTEKGNICICAKPIEGARVLITVKDTGIGISTENLESIFQEFTQVDTSSTRKVGGTGLGLPISRRLVAMHGGRLWAESSGVNGKGSTFFVELPVEARISDVIEKQAK